MCVLSASCHLPASAEQQSATDRHRSIFAMDHAQLDIALHLIDFIKLTGIAALN
jgi:hypothetical protein